MQAHVVAEEAAIMSHAATRPPPVGIWSTAAHMWRCVGASSQAGMGEAQQAASMSGRL